MANSSESVGIIDLILSEHKYMRDEYEQFKSIEDTAELDPRVREWIAYICLYGHKEEVAFYPNVEVYLQDEKKGGHHIIQHGIKEHRELETELKTLSEEPTVTWKQIRKSIQKLMHHLDEEETDILQVLRSKLDQNTQLELARQFVHAGQIASAKPHPELSDKPERAPVENIHVAIAEKQ